MLKLPNELNVIDPIPKLGAKIVEPTPPIPEPQSDWECATISDMLVVRPKEPDGWIPHTPGDPMPCGPDEEVFVLLRNSKDAEGAHLAAKLWSWNEIPLLECNEIIAWRRA